MSNTDYSNAGKKKPESVIPERDIKPVVSGTRAKKTVKDDISKVGSYLLTETIIPAAKKLLSEFISRGADMLIFKNDPPTTPFGNYGYGGVDYTKRYGSPSMLSSVASAGLPGIPGAIGLGSQSIDNFIVNSYHDGQKVLQSVSNLLASYGTISVYEVCKLMGVAAKYTDYDWGWTDIRGAKIVPFRNKYKVELPPPISLK